MGRHKFARLAHLQATNKFYLAAVVLGDSVLETVRRELRRVSDAKVELDELREALKQEVIKREVLEGEKADGARKKVAKSAGKMLRIRKGKDEADETTSPVIPAAPEDPTRELT